MKATFPLLFLLIFQTAFSQGQKAKHVILIGFDGLGAYAIPNADMPHLKQLMEEGSWTLQARSVLPSSSAVNWASMLMGADPTAHGYTEWNSATPEIPSGALDKYGLFPTVFGQIRQQRPELKTAAIYRWEGIAPLLEKEAIDLIVDGKGDDERCVEEAVNLIQTEKSDFLFIHLSQPDNVGHEIGHATPEYYAELKNVDRRIGQILEAVKKAGIEDDTIILISSDHGGTGKGHGGKSTAEVYIPWLIKGPGIKKDHQIKDLVMTYDTAATIAQIFGLTSPQAWRGKTIGDALSEKQD
jgi:predicted AlkP superfamily pyrophosphatase or phosphodiesterase